MHFNIHNMSLLHFKQNDKNIYAHKLRKISQIYDKMEIVMFFAQHIFQSLTWQFSMFVYRNKLACLV